MKNSLGEAQGKMDLAQRRNGATKNGSRATTQRRNEKWISRNDADKNSTPCAPCPPCEIKNSFRSMAQRKIHLAQRRNDATKNGSRATPQPRNENTPHFGSRNDAKAQRKIDLTQRRKDATKNGSRADRRSHQRT